MKRIVVVSLALFFLVVSQDVSAQAVDKNLAADLAISFLRTHMPPLRDPDKQDIRVVAITEIKAGDHLSLYAIDFDPEAWVLVSASQSVYPVAAFSFTGKWSQNADPWTMWVSEYAQSVKNASRAGQALDLQVISAWDYYLSDGLASDRKFRNVQPMLQSTWDQGVPYNAACPVDPNGPGGHAVTGCVATACAQLMYYFRFPEHGSGSYSYVHPVYGTIAEDFSSATYEWDKMLNVALTSNPEMAEIAYHFGVSVDMVYGPNSSGMYNHKAAYSLKTHFNYSPQTQYVFRDSTNMDWDSLLTTHLHRSIPMYYAGWAAQGSLSGHAFICDGYQSTAQGNFYHFNWGWGGSQDGYFYTNNLSPGGYQFSFSQELIINAYPDTINFVYPHYCNGTRILQSMAGTIDDGSGPTRPYGANSNCSWLIDPQVAVYDSVRNIELRFDRFDTEPGIDKLAIYDGADTSAPLIGVYSGNTLPPVIQSTSNKLFVTFSSNDTTEFDGFFLSYKAITPVWCSGTKTLTAPAGVFDDGSGIKHYNNGSMCRWLIQPTGAQEVTLGFNRFETEAGKDFLRIYDWNTQQLLGTFSGNQLPPTLTSTTGALFLEFSTNSDLGFSGWEASYTSSGAGISRQERRIIPAFPNPGKGVFILPLDFEGSCTITVTDLRGRIMHHEAREVRHNQQQLDLSHLADGVYIVNIGSGLQVLYARLVLIR